MKRVLSVDGGGIRGILPAMLLARLEERRGKPVGELFDLVAGTSTGAIIACGVAAGVPAATMVDLYANQGPAIFREPLWRAVLPLSVARYGGRPLDQRLLKVLGTTWLSSWKLRCKLLVPTYVTQLPEPIDIDLDGTAEMASALLFRSWVAQANSRWDFRLCDIARASSAAPTYFPAAKIYNRNSEPFICIDGGTFANNPALLAWSAARDLWPDEEITLVSLGTGTLVEAVRAGDWGVAKWIAHIFSAFMDGAADTVSYTCRQILGRNFVRCEVPLPPYMNSAFDDASLENIMALDALGRDYTDTFIGSIA